MQNLPDQFYKSRLASITTSVVAFIVSITSKAELENIEIFGVTVRSINQPFLIISLLTAAGISLASLYYIYRNEGLRYISDRSETLDKESPEKTLDHLNKALAKLNFPHPIDSDSINKLLLMTKAAAGNPIILSDEDAKAFSHQIANELVNDDLPELAEIMLRILPKEASFSLDPQIQEQWDMMSSNTVDRIFFPLHLTW